MKPEVKKLFILGIVGAALSWCPVAGLIVSIIGLCSVRAAYQYEPLAVRARIGKYLSIYGVIMNACVTVYLIMMLTVLGGVASAM